MWAGFDGRAYTREQWVAHVADTPVFPAATRIVEHSTGVPTLAQWLTFNEADYVRNVQSYYENSLHWSHGPHVFASFRDIIGFSNLSTRGTHASCWNSDSIGLECGINRNTEDWSSGPGAAALANQHFAIATLMIKMGIGPSPLTYLPHSACIADGHSQCPIADFEKYRSEESAAIVGFMNALGGKLTPNPALAAQAKPIYPAETAPLVGSMAWVQTVLNKAGAAPAIPVDNDNGPLTKAAVARFQGLRGLYIDGIVGPDTLAALKAAA
jgi:hypothetical protein